MTVSNFGAKPKLVFGLRHTALDNFREHRAAAYQAFAEFLHRRRLDENGQSTLAVELLDIATAHYIYIEYNILSGSQFFSTCAFSVP